MKMRTILSYIFVLVAAQSGCVEAKCYVWEKCWREKADKDIKSAAGTIKHEIEKAGGVITKVGAKVGDVTIKGISKTGDVTIDVAGKAGNVVLKTGQAVVTSSGMTLLNAGGMVVALTSGDIKNIKACAKAASASTLYGVSTVVDESLKIVGSIDKLIQIESVSLEASSAELALQGKTPKVSLKGSFLGKNFNFKNVQLDLSDPDKLVADLLDMLVKLQ